MAWQGLRTRRLSNTLLTGDIGATHSRISFFLADEQGSGFSLKLLHQETYPSQEYASLLEILQLFTHRFPQSANMACFGIPGPVKGETSVTTNLPWQVVAREIESGLKIPKVWLLNDLEAIAHGLLQLDDDDFKALNPLPIPGEGGNAAVIAPGSGLGEAGIYWDGERYHPFGSEGGHASFAPSTSIQIELLQYLLKKYSRVSWERLLSGPGIVHIYSFLRDTKKAPEPEWLRTQLHQGVPAKIITESALAGNAELCQMTVDLFVELLASEAATLALKMMATGGIYIGGGIMPNLLPAVDTAHFQETFTRQGRLSKVLETIPVRVILNGEAGMIGCAHYALAKAPDHAETPVGLSASTARPSLQEESHSKSHRAAKDFRST